jgi:hypothetical protein
MDPARKTLKPCHFGGSGAGGLYVVAILGFGFVLEDQDVRIRQLGHWQQIAVTASACWHEHGWHEQT